MLLNDRFRKLARRHLPPGLRRPLGILAGFADHHVIHPLAGLWFDLSGGRFRTDGCEFEIPRKITSRSYRATFVLGNYEEDERELIRKFLKPEDSVLEFGACMGIVSCVTNKLLRDKSRHVVVEANPMLIPTIHRNREINRCGFLVENCAGSNQRELTFYLHPLFVVGGTYQRESGREVRVPGRSILELNERYGPFTTLIMDVEGAELDLLQGSSSLLQQFRLIILETHAWAIGEGGVQLCREILTAAGLTLQERAGATEAWLRT
jgi:FkbM family methyltransferase